jgi:hypothetical protein
MPNARVLINNSCSASVCRVAAELFPDQICRVRPALQHWRNMHAAM